jgi:hypothetical protein
MLAMWHLMYRFCVADDGRKTTLLVATKSAGTAVAATKPVVVIAGSLSCPPFRYLGPKLSRVAGLAVVMYNKWRFIVDGHQKCG